MGKNRKRQRERVQAPIKNEPRAATEAQHASDKQQDSAPVARTKANVPPAGIETHQTNKHEGKSRDGWRTFFEASTIVLTLLVMVFTGNQACEAKQARMAAERPWITIKLTQV